MIEDNYFIGNRLVDPFDVQQMSNPAAAEFPFLANLPTLWDDHLAQEAGRNVVRGEGGMVYSERYQAWGHRDKFARYEREGAAADALRDSWEPRNIGDHYNEFAEGVGGFVGRIFGGAVSGAAGAVTKNIPWGLIVIAVVILMVKK